MAAPLSPSLPASTTSGDPITETLELTGARCALSRGLVAAGDWALAFPAPGRLKIQVVIHGVVWLVIEGIEHPVRLEAGDIAVFAGDRRYTLASDPAVPAIDALPVLRASTDTFFHVGDEGRDAVTIGGHIDLNTTGKDLLLSALPPMMHVGAATAEAPAACWLMDRTLHEMRSDAPGAAFAADHLAQLLFVQVLRVFLANANADTYPTGWLRALADERVAPALRLMHGDPARSWSLTELARAAAMSRTSFAQRFKEVAGLPPLTYLYVWRMRLARHILRREDTPVAAIAASLGYGSESAFSNAFKRTTGVAPRRYREAARAN
ncbi:AraC family transcriptional regulator [Streptomyces sp. NPDC002221]|uniref:AraC family transcriptional regulator n=1 Tax=Streptomyces sp. NPDC002221 TaxID=3364639 RepID=UPI0036C39522